MSAYDRLYLGATVRTHASLFRILSREGADVFDAIRLYMISFQRSLMDVGNPLALNKTPKQLISRMYDGYALSANTEKVEYDEFIMNWMARIYVSLQYETCKSSVEIVNVLKPEWLYEHYYPLHEASISNGLRKVLDIFWKPGESANGIIGFHKEGEPYGFLSNWYLSRFSIGDKCFSSVEQWIMYRKAMVFNDAASAERIMAEINPVKIKEIGRNVAGYVDSVWASVRYNELLKGLRAKFTQSDELRDLLLGTGSVILAEFASNDKIYGVGISNSDPNRFNREYWTGQNLLGAALLQVRDELGSK